MHGKGDSCNCPDNFEKIVGSPSIIEKLNFTSMTLHKAFASMSREGSKKNGINHVPPKSLPCLCLSFMVE